MVGTTEKLTIWQQNVNKSPSCQHNLISNNHLANMGVGLIALQEPAINPFNLTTATKDWTPIYPTPHGATSDRTRAITLIRSNISTDSWTQLDFPSSDVTIIQINGLWGKITIFNIYNDCDNNDTIKLLANYYNRNRAQLERADSGTANVIWLGDFNRHHPLWDDPNDDRLFTTEAIHAAEELIEAIADIGLELALPSGTPMHQHNATKSWSRLDHVFLSEHSDHMLISCDTRTDLRGILTDHLPIITVLDLEMEPAADTPFTNFREVDWEKFRLALEMQLSTLPPAERILNQHQLDSSCGTLTAAIQSTIQEQVPVTEITPKSKRWWTKELTILRKQANKLGRQSYKRRMDPSHAVHTGHKEAAKMYVRTLKNTKQQHWRSWLERAKDPDIWTVHRLISAPASDGGKARIPALKYRVGEDDRTATTNSEKGAALAKGFFPQKPQTPDTQEDEEYPKACSKAGKVTKDHIRKHLKKLKPYKAPGPDGIPNIVLTKNADLLIDRLHPIYEAMLDKNLHYSPWKTFTTVVLRKPGKPHYDIPKAYRPIALLNTMWKVLTAIVADQITFLTEKHQLLPKNHFGGRPGRTTTDAMHLLTLKIKAAWRAGKVASVLFLDIEGAFPNAVPERLVHNLRKRRIPRKYTKFIDNMLRDRVTTLKFDGYSSAPIHIDNGIGQGDPLSMVLYQYYNADLLDIPNNKDEDAMAYVDDSLMLAIAKSFEEAHEKLADMMGREGGVTEWSTTHNSPLEYSKLALMDFAHSQSQKRRPALQLPQREVKPVTSTKYLGVFFDQNLNWKAQQAHAIKKGTQWAAQIRRIAKQTWGITPKYARRLYISVALPRALYAIDLWCTPTQRDHPGPRAIGSAKVMRQLTSLQRIAATAITGGLRTSPTDALDACAFLLPSPLNIDKQCHRALTRMAMLPKDHPLHSTVKRKNTRDVKRHRTAIHHLLDRYQDSIDPYKIEEIPATSCDPILAAKIPFTISISEDRESSMREAANAEEEVQVFSDGSAMEGKVGAAAILLRAGKPARALHFHLGSEDKHTVHEAELVGILLGLHLISTESKNGTTFALGSDNQAAIKAFQSNLRSPGHHLAREALCLAHQILHKKRKTKYALTIRWTAGHEGIEGNEAADREAKKAAEGLTTEPTDLPAYLRKPLLTNPSALKRAHSDRLKHKWTTTWRQSERGRKMLQIDSSTPSNKFLKAISSTNITRSTASLISQLRLTHIPLNSYLKRFKRVDSASCPACGAEDENIVHFLLFCPAYAHERWALARQVKKQRKTLSIETLLGDPNLVISLGNFVHATQRFTPHGEQTISLTQ